MVVNLSVIGVIVIILVDFNIRMARVSITISSDTSGTTTSLGTMFGFVVLFRLVSWLLSRGRFATTGVTFGCVILNLVILNPVAPISRIFSGSDLATTVTISISVIVLISVSGVLIGSDLAATVTVSISVVNLSLSPVSRIFILNDLAATISVSISVIDGSFSCLGSSWVIVVSRIIGKAFRKLLYFSESQCGEVLWHRSC